MMLNCPRFERPREKAIYNGIETLSNQELIAVILRTGNKEMSVLNLASLLLEEIGGFQALKDVDYYQLTKIKGIKQAKAIELMASIELAKRMLKENTKRFVIKEPQDGYEYIKHKLMFEKQEKKSMIRKHVIIFAGTTEGRILANWLDDQPGITGVVCVATEYGAEVLTEESWLKHLKVHCGRLNEKEIEMFLEKEKPSLVIDATHPYARELTAYILKAFD